MPEPTRMKDKRSDGGRERTIGRSDREGGETREKSRRAERLNPVTSFYSQCAK